MGIEIRGRRQSTWGFKGLDKDMVTHEEDKKLREYIPTLCWKEHLHDIAIDKNVDRRHQERTMDDFN